MLNGEQEFVKANEDLKNYFSKSQANQVSAERIFNVKFSELDLRTGSCKLSLDENESEERINGQISDPLLGTPNNPYVNAFANGAFLQVKGKAVISPDEEISKLFISDVLSSKQS